MTIETLIDKIKSYHPTTDEALIRRAYHAASVAHEGQKRNSGEPYIIHPLHVAYILAELQMDDATICAGLLHDVLEDTEFTKDDMITTFGEEITTLVDGVTKLKQLQSKSKVENQVDNYRKMVMAMANDIRVIIVKLADRLHNLRTLDYKDREKQIEKATETIEIYVPIAHRLGISTIKSELEDLCLKFLDPDAYYEVSRLVNKRIDERKAFIHEIIQELSEELDKLNMKFEISGRPKTLYSIYKKMYQQNKSFDQIFDVSAIRVIVDTVKDCYSVLGVVHTLWKPIPRRFKDYIAMPKANMYQSLHTTLIGPGGETFEVQIRTYEMHQTAEYGIAAHWSYKEGKSKRSSFDEKLTWVRQLMEWQKTTTDSSEYMETLKGDFFSDEVYVFSPQGDVVELARGSTPVDFAYRIHSDVGNHCVGAKVNGRLVPLDHVLENGVIVEILTSKNSAGPSRDWLKFVKTPSTKQKIRQYFKHAKRDENIEMGRDMIVQDLKKDGVPPNEAMTEEALQNVIARMSFSSPNDLFAAVGFGSQTVGSVTSKLKELFEEKREKEAEKNREKESDKAALHVPTQQKGPTAGDDTIRIRGEGVTNLQVKFAQCCTPVPGDKIVGYITMGRGISVHRADCVNILNTQNPERLIEVEWDQTENTKFFSTITIRAANKTGYMASVVELMTKQDVNMSGIQAHTDPEGNTTTIVLTLEIEDANQVQELMRKIRQLQNTISVYRTKS
ncbi:MAG: bifunctional (p)ppGpp synthetase/guanosine-3',5'-bis(diphosphate) 3'-pyrophosphohydrolase [Peptoniphilaceae bacterium]|nr:bifunctional (p)ppGpp synthetase/guanosine-3',5'-bis(diphosphate) 3'-pyrophosphohydrolase [Peptoniphilaceae bacterium]MDY6086004.1 bifunctional (p)ppGpp synthetase/guanosine-3',5'-bis(diphosphate) 3'-pyrophosphohydrolase [Peptoniphilaceae bacterium]